MIVTRRGVPKLDQRQSPMPVSISGTSPEAVKVEIQSAVCLDWGFENAFSGREAQRAR